MIIWGSGGGSAVLGAAQARACPTCEKERPFKVLLTYRYAHLYYLFRWVTKKQYHLVCDVCRRGALLNTKDIESKLTKSPIPFMTRYGWAVALGVVAFIVAFIAIVGPAQPHR